jgi:hypothetical protein
MRSIIATLVAVQLACSAAQADRTAAPNSAAPASATPPASSTQAAPTPVRKADAQQPVVANPLAPEVKAFLDRVTAYIAVRSKADDGIPKLTETSDPNKIAEREKALGEALVAARAGAKPGDVFAPEFLPTLNKIIKDDFSKRTMAERKALIVELPKGVKFGVNQVYPTTIPLATCPPKLLKALPELPSDIEYRIVYRHLILRDVKGNYVIDMVPNVFPIPA